MCNVTKLDFLEVSRTIISEQCSVNSSSFLTQYIQKANSLLKWLCAEPRVL